MPAWGAPTRATSAARVISGPRGRRRGAPAERPNAPGGRGRRRCQRFRACPAHQVPLPVWRCFVVPFTVTAVPRGTSRSTAGRPGRAARENPPFVPSSAARSVLWRRARLYGRHAHDDVAARATRAWQRRPRLGHVPGDGAAPRGRRALLNVSGRRRPSRRPRAAAHRAGPLRASRPPPRVWRSARRLHAARREGELAYDASRGPWRMANAPLRCSETQSAKVMSSAAAISSPAL